MDNIKFYDVWQRFTFNSLRLAHVSGMSQLNEYVIL